MNLEPIFAYLKCPYYLQVLCKRTPVKLAIFDNSTGINIILPNLKMICIDKNLKVTDAYGKVLHEDS